jgi:hypothetical protein
MPTGWTGSAAIAPAMALTDPGPVSSRSHPRNPRDPITRTAEPRRSTRARGVGRRLESNSAADAAGLERLGLCIAGLKQPSARRAETTEAVAKHYYGPGSANARNVG